LKPSTDSPLTSGTETDSVPSFFRRLAAMFYDAILLLAVLFLAAALLLPFNSGEAVTAKYIIYPYYLLVSFVFYGWFWTKDDGQTVGLKTWKLQLKNFDGQAFTWKHALIRFFSALVGLGLLWSLVDKKSYSLQDHLSKSRLLFDKDA